MLGFSCITNIAVLSANVAMETFVFARKSAIYNKYRNGSKTLLCETLDSIS